MYNEIFLFLFPFSILFFLLEKMGNYDATVLVYLVYLVFRAGFHGGVACRCNSIPGWDVKKGYHNSLGSVYTKSQLCYSMGLLLRLSFHFL